MPDEQPRGDEPQNPSPEDVVESAQPIAEEDITQALPEPRPAAQPEPEITAGRAAERDVRTLSLTAACAVLALLTILFAWMVFAPSSAPLKLGATRDAAAAREDHAIIRTAERFAKNFLSVDYRTIEADFDRATADASDQFKGRVEEVLRLSHSRFLTAHARSTFEITHSFLVEHTGNNALVEVIGRRTIRNASTKGSRSESQELHVVLVKTDYGWKVSDLGTPRSGSK